MGPKMSVAGGWNHVPPWVKAALKFVCRSSVYIYNNYIVRIFYLYFCWSCFTKIAECFPTHVSYLSYMLSVFLTYVSVGRASYLCFCWSCVRSWLCESSDSVVFLYALSHYDSVRVFKCFFGVHSSYMYFCRSCFRLWLCGCFYLYLCGSSVFHIVILCVFLAVFPWVIFNIVTAFVRVLTRVSVGRLTEPPTT